MMFNPLSRPTRQGSGKIQTTDHLVTYRLFTQKSRKWRMDMWVAAIGFEKAFDSIQHERIWKALRNHSVSEQYVCFLKNLYTDLRATALTDVESDKFGIARVTKQGDPLSSLFFNSVLQSAMEKDTTWKEKGLT